MNQQSGADSAKNLWRPRALPGVEVLHAANVRYSRNDQALNAGYTIKIAVDGTPPPMQYRGRVVAPGAVGMVTVLEPDELLQARGPQTAASYRVLIVDPALLPAASKSGKRPTFPLAHQPDEALWRDLRRLHDDLAAGEDALTVQSEFTTALERLTLRHANTHWEPPAAPPPPGLRTVRDMLHDRLDANLTLDELANAAGCGKRQLLRSFQLAYGAPPHTYRTLVRLDRAKAMLARGMTAAEVAAEVGYYDQSQLNRHFRRVWGTSAGAYAKSIR